MDTLPDENLEIKYREYQNEAELVKKGRLRVFNQYRLVMILGLLIAVAPLLGILPSYAFWAGMLLVVIGFGLAYGMSNKYAEKESDKISATRQGFTEFYKLYFRGFWPKEMPVGKELEKFVSILGRKEA